MKSEGAFQGWWSQYREIGNLHESILRSENDELVEKL